MTEKTAFQKFLIEGRGALTNDEFRDFEQRALQMDSSPAGGYIVTPEQFVNQILKKLDDMVAVRRYGTIIPCRNAHSLGNPFLDSDPGDESLDWTSEIGEVQNDTQMDFEKRDLNPHPLARMVKISKTLVRRSVIDIEDFAAGRLAYVFSIVQEHNYLNGNGSNRPLGLFTASDQGISTDRDVSTGNTTSAIKADGLIEAEAALKPQYRKNARWIFHRDAIKQIRKLKDGDGNYLWVQGLQGQPNTILGYPYTISEYCPNTFTSGSYVGLLGDLSFFWIAVALDFQTQVLTERFATTNQNAIIGRLEEDGMPVIEEAFVRVTLA